MIKSLKNRRIKITGFSSFTLVLFTFTLLLFPLFSSAQVKSSIDSTSIKIGEQITYKFEVEADTTDLVVFPEGQTFSPLEVIESYKVDTIKQEAKYNLIKKYGLTQFDSGAYIIPKQKVIIGDKTFTADSLKVEVRDVVVDTTKQGLYDIKPMISVDKTPSKWWLYLLLTLLILSITAALLYWFVWREKPLTEEEQIALLPPYDRAKLALKKLEESHYLEHDEIKAYYSELTLIIRAYLDEKVYDHALESTTDELIGRLQLLKDGNQIDLNVETIKNLESILKRADLVKFAKAKPDVALAELDRTTIDLEIDHVREVLPEPSEEEKLLDEKYREQQERKKKRRKIIITVVVGVLLLVLTYVGFSLKYGFTYVKDTIVGHDSKELLESHWVNSEYGFPPVSISTPQVLKRMEVPLPEELQGKIKMSIFGYEQEKNFTVALTTTNLTQTQDSLDINQAIEGNLKGIEDKGAKNIFTQNEEFTTPNGAEGIKTYGTLSFPIEEGSDQFIAGKYVLLSFVSDNKIIQQLVLTWKQGDEYADQIVERILNSIELTAKEEE